MKEATETGKWHSTRRAVLLLTSILGLAAWLATPGAMSAAPERPSPYIDDPAAWELFAVEQKDFSKRIVFTNVHTQKTWSTRYRGIRWNTISAINLLVPEDLYLKRSLRVRYKLRHPLSGQRLQLVARAKTREVMSVPLRLERDELSVELFAEKDERKGLFTYDHDSRLLVEGLVDGRFAEIEAKHDESFLDNDVVRYLLLPFPVVGEFEVRLDGEVVAHFVKHEPHGQTSPYSLALRRDLDDETRESSLSAFLVFVLMKTLVD